MIFNDPELNLRAEYTLFDRQTGRPVCVGNGETCQRLTQHGVEQLPCPSPDICPLAQGGQCKPYGRLHVNLDDSDELGTFIFRTTGYNSIRTFAARLNYYHAASCGLLSCLPLQLTLRGKSTTQSYRIPVYYVDLTLRDGVCLKDAIQMAKEVDQQSKDAGFYQEALDFIAKAGFNNAVFELQEDDGMQIAEEFYPEISEQADHSHIDGQQRHHTKTQHNSEHTEPNPVMQLTQGLRQSVKAVN